MSKNNQAAIEQLVGGQSRRRSVRPRARASRPFCLAFDSGTSPRKPFLTRRAAGVFVSTSVDHRYDSPGSGPSEVVVAFNLRLPSMPWIRPGIVCGFEVADGRCQSAPPVAMQAMLCVGCDEGAGSNGQRLACP